MRPERDRDEVKRLHRLGLNACQIARQTGIPRSTLRDWLNPRYEPRPRRASMFDLVAVPKAEYAYLLGFYLGDGTISLGKRGVYRLRIFTDAQYPSIIEECASAMRAVLPDNRVAIQPLPSKAVCISVWSKQLPSLFPQLGPGRKHTRKIELAPWQEAIVAERPTACWFLRGLIHSDGCRVINHVNGGEYPRYFFSQVSTDIQQIFCDACDRLGIEYRRNRRNSVSIARRPSVAMMDSIVGPKS